MTLSILSDLHLDFHFKSFKQTKEEVQKFFDPIFTPVVEGVKIKPSDVLVVAGDLGHYNTESVKIIGFLRELYFEHIVCVLGNHDYYLINRIAMDDYDMNSYKRAQEMREMLNAIDGVYCLNGNVIEIEGVRFGGCDSWYDGNYVLHNLNPHFVTTMDDVRTLWKYVMNDAAYMPNLKLFDELWEIEKPKIEATYQQVDVMITHVSPSIKPEHIPEVHYRKDDSTSFFTFDGEKYVSATTAKMWIYGHTHTANEYEWHGVQMICNPLGYPGENKNIKDKRIEIDLKREK
jgi:3',5'-cyclic AMP phosphodiesterase CpdA